jgi:3-oxoadipate enol-lactonase
MAAATSEGFAPVPGGQLHYERAGTGPALVLIHSAFLDAREWDPQFRDYASQFTVVRYDVRGWGRSKGDRTGASDAEDLTALLNHLGLTKAFLLGNSNGATIACDFAAGLPDRVPALILVGGAPRDLAPTSEEEARFVDALEPEQMLLELARAGRKAEAVEQILSIWAPEVDDATRAQLRTVASDNYETFLAYESATEPVDRPPAYPVAAGLRAAQIPILSIAGAHDSPALVMMMGRYAAGTPTAHHVELPDGDHTPSLSARAAFDREVLGFLRTVRDGGRWPPER